MFSTTNNPIDTNKLSNNFSIKEAGAFVCFEGRVRCKNNGHDVSHLEYEGEEKLAQNEFINIVNEAHKQHKILDILCVHRLGKVEIEEISLWVGVLSVHRKDAFLACHYIVNELKRRLPIWKKEFYIDKTSQWIDECHG